MYPNSPPRCSIVHRSKHEFHVSHYPRSTYFSSNPSDRPSIDGVVGSSTSETVLFQRNVPKPFPSGLSCDCTNSAKYTFSSLCFNRTAGGNEDRSVNAARVQLPVMVCALRGKVIQVDTKKKWKTRVRGGIVVNCRCIVGLREVTPDRCLGVGSQLMFQPGRDVDYTTKDEGESCGGKGQDYVEGDEERPRSRAASTRVV